EAALGLRNSAQTRSGRRVRILRYARDHAYGEASRKAALSLPPRSLGGSSFAGNGGVLPKQPRSAKRLRPLHLPAQAHQPSVDGCALSWDRRKQPAPKCCASSATLRRKTRRPRIE